MNEEKQVLRIGIDGRWEASDFAASFTALDRLYSLRLGFAIQMDDFAARAKFFPSARYVSDLPPPEYLYWRAGLASRFNFRAEYGPLVRASRISGRLSELIEPEERLQVLRVKYGSEGSKDFCGVGAAIGHLKEFLIYLIDLWKTNPQRGLENERRALENENLRHRNEQLQIENAKRLVQLGHQVGYSELEQRQIVAAVIHEQKPLVQLIADGKIISASSGNESPS